MINRSELAEGVGFEPTRERNPLPVFKTGALNHSAILPDLEITQEFSTTRPAGQPSSTAFLPDSRPGRGFYPPVCSLASRGRRRQCNTTTSSQMASVRPMGIGGNRPVRRSTGERRQLILCGLQGGLDLGHGILRQRRTGRRRQFCSNRCRRDAHRNRRGALPNARTRPRMHTEP
jgi:hypothetical protein